MAYPSSVTTFTTKVDGVDYPTAAHINTIQTDLNGVENMLGANGVRWIADEGMFGGQINVSVAFGGLYVQLNLVGGTNVPTSTNPVYGRFANTIRTATAALALVAANGTNWCNSGGAELATKEVDYFVYLAWSATDAAMCIGISRIPYARKWGDFSATSTNENYAYFRKGSNAAHSLASADVVICVGRFAATLSAGAGYTWSVPTYTAINLIQKPIYETRLLDWTPTHTRATTAYTNTPATQYAKYQINYDKLFVSEQHLQNATPGGTGFQRVTLPFTNPTAFGLDGKAINATSVVAFSALYTGSGNYVSLIKYDGTAEATASQYYALDTTYRLV